MAIASVLGRASSSMAPLAFRVLRTPRSFYHSAFLARSGSARLTQEICRKIPSLSRSFSASSAQKRDSDLLEVIGSEIKCAEEADYHDLKDEIPDGFPFEIQDNPGEQVITLKREYAGEIITVEVHMPDLEADEEGGDDGEGEGSGGDDGNDDDSEGAGQSSLTLVVNVSKGDGPTLEFCCSAYPDEVTIDTMSFKDREASKEQLAYEGPDFSDLDEDLQKAFRKYLERRGIKSSTTNFLHDYMMNKDSREYLQWLKNLEKFIGKQKAA